MHRCNPDDTTPCNAFCHGTTHVDLAYCDTELLVAFGPQMAREGFTHSHTEKHREQYHTRPCAILAMDPAPEAPEMRRRYPQYGPVEGVTAFRIVYQLTEE